MASKLAKRILEGDARAAAQALTLLESGDRRATALLKDLYPKTGRAYIVGVTGAPGAGKSSLIDCLAKEYRRSHSKLGILAVDPTSPLTGGALLGDRLRMRDHFLDEGIFIRSLATRGAQGGVSAATRGAIHLLDAMGKEMIFVETIGAGQNEVAISTLVHTVLVVVTPWMGDEVQAMKAGLLEIADFLIINKSDLPGSEDTLEQLRGVYEGSGLRVFPTSSVKKEGIGELVEGIECNRQALLADGNHRARNLKISRQEILSLLEQKLLTETLTRLEHSSVARLVEQVAERNIDPYSAVEKIARKVGL